MQYVYIVVMNNITAKITKINSNNPLDKSINIQSTDFKKYNKYNYTKYLFIICLIFLIYYIR